MGEEQQGNESGQAASSNEASSSDSSAGTQGDTFMDTHGNSRLTTEEYRNDQRAHEDKMIRRSGEAKEG